MFENIREEGLNLELTKNDENNGNNGDCVKITVDDIQPKVDYWTSAIVCYILGYKPPFRIVNRFIRRIWGKVGVEKVAMIVKWCFHGAVSNGGREIKSLRG